MDTELERLRKAVAEARRLREEAEERARVPPLMLYLEACHSLGLAIQVVDRPLTAQSDTTNPVGRIYPQRIAGWDDFPARQENIWDLFDQSFASHPFPSPHRMDYVRSLIDPIGSEPGLRVFERDTVEIAVRKLIGAVSENALLRDRLGLRGSVTFDRHTNFGAVDDELLEPLGHVSLAGSSAGAAVTTTRKPRRAARGKGNRADQACVYRTADGANIPTMAIEYKPPHKLRQEEVVTGLASEIQPARDVINKDGDGFAFASRALAAAVVTQLFSYMVGKGVQYGYVCTGQVFVFLHIPDDPATVFYHVCVPNLDVLEDDENRLHRTAVAQVFAFTLQALRAQPPPQSWHDAAEGLDIWDVKFEDVLSKIPETVRKDKARASPYEPQRWCGFTRSPIWNRPRCKHPSIEFGPQDEDDEEAPPSPTPNEPTTLNEPTTPNQPTRSGRTLATSSTGSSRKADTSSASPGKGRGGGSGVQSSIRDRPYCTHQCLLGLARGGSMDQSCPNAPSHGQIHIDRPDFLRLLSTQLAHDRGRDADSTPLYLAGAMGALFKVRLSAHGYTLVAKGVESANHGRLRHEEDIYNQLSTVQGLYVPVCLGLIDLSLPYYFDGGIFEHFMLLSWAGRPLFECDLVDKVLAADAITRAYIELHRLGVCHRDAAVRNILYDGNPMIVDFERAEFRGRQPLGPLGPSGQRRRGVDPFVEELRSVVRIVSRYFG